MKLSEKPEFKNWVKTVDIRRESRTRKTRKSEDPIMFESLHEEEAIIRMISVRPVSEELEQKLISLNKSFQQEMDPIVQRILLIEYDILVEGIGELDNHDREIIQRLRRELDRLIRLVKFPLERIEPLCLKISTPMSSQKSI